MMAETRGGPEQPAAFEMTENMPVGMGLHIVRNVLGNHRGRLDIGRSPLGGAEFRIVLPRPT